MLVYRIRNPRDGETLTVNVESEQDETELRNWVMIYGWEIVSIDCA